MAGAGNHVAARIAGDFGRRAHRGDAIRVEGYRRLRPDASSPRCQRRAPRRSLAHCRDLRFHAVEHGRIGVAQVDRDEDFARNDVGRAGLDLERPTVPTAFGACARATGVDRFDQPRGAEQRVVRRGIGVVPAWLSWPVTVTSYQRIACTPVTTPMSLPSASR